MIKNRLIISILVLSISILVVGCSTSSDKFVGKWYDSKGELNSEIQKNGDKYTWQTFNKGEKTAFYEGLNINEDGYLLHERENKFWGFKYIDENTIESITIWKSANESTYGEIEIDSKLTRGKE